MKLVVSSVILFSVVTTCLMQFPYASCLFQLDFLLMLLMSCDSCALSIHMAPTEVFSTRSNGVEFSIETNE